MFPGACQIIYPVVVVVAVKLRYNPKELIPEAVNVEECATGSVCNVVLLPVNADP